MRGFGFGRIRSLVAVPALVLALILPGCTPDAERDGAQSDERESCTLKVSACVIDCHKANTLKECPDCCRANGKACDVGKSYSFYSCQLLE